MYSLVDIVFLKDKIVKDILWISSAPQNMFGKRRAFSPVNGEPLKTHETGLDGPVSFRIVFSQTYFAPLREGNELRERSQTENFMVCSPRERAKETFSYLESKV